eukprot:Skav200164  [mRNA]  locus=scaffold6219:66320:71204:- [translate_table: standard]
MLHVLSSGRCGPHLNVTSTDSLCTSEAPRQALNHEWIKNKAPRAQSVHSPQPSFEQVQDVPRPLRSNFVDNLRGFQSQNKLKKDEIKKLREAFTSLDKNGDGLLTHAELKDGLGKAGLKEIPPDLAAIMDGVDADGSGVIDYTEFLAATLDRHGASWCVKGVCWVLQSSEVEDALGIKAIADLMVEVDSNLDQFGVDSVSLVLDRSSLQTAASNELSSLPTARKALSSLKIQRRLYIYIYILKGI